MGAREWKDRYTTVVGDFGWQERAACRGALSAPPLDEKSLCRRCPVTSECLRFALDNGCNTGVWGGLDENERKALKRRATA